MLGNLYSDEKSFCYTQDAKQKTPTKTLPIIDLPQELESSQLNITSVEKDPILEVEETVIPLNQS